MMDFVGADDIASGERQNLVIWSTNLKYRRSKRFRTDQSFREEAAPPDPRCLSYTHDRDYPVYRDYPLDRTYRSSESREVSNFAFKMMDFALKVMN